MSLVCIDYGAGNTRSLVNGFRKIGSDVALVDEPKALKGASGIILPGVGSFGDAMVRLRDFLPALKDAIGSGTPFLGLCLGQQVLFETSQESPGVLGFGLFKGECVRFTGDIKVPHMGWNTLKNIQDTPLLEGIRDDDFFYFVHSYYVVPKDGSCIAATTGYGIDFPSVLSAGNVYATQFHPEKSSDKGMKILGNFVSECRR